MPANQSRVKDMISSTAMAFERLKKDLQEKEYEIVRLQQALIIHESQARKSS